MFDFSNKTVLITGATRGIGRATLEAFANSNANVAYLYTSSKEVAIEIDKQWENCNVMVRGYQVDVTDFNQLHTTIDQIIHDFGRVDILVNNAGVTDDNYLMLMSEESWNRVINVNLNGVFNVTKQIIFHFIEHHGGKIVNVASVSGIIGQSCQTNYSASKAGMIGFTKSLAKEVAGNDINVNAIAPGFIETEMLDTIPDRVLKQYKDKIPQKRFGRKEEVVNVIMFLASEYAKYIQGDVITVDGGLTA